MIRSIVLLALYLISTSAHIVSNPFAHYSDALKIKCDSLPFRTIYFERNCYFVIDTEGDISTSTKRCSSALTDAKVVQPGKVPEEVWSWLFVDKKSFIGDNDSTGKTKAMCIFENRFPFSIGVHTSNGPGAAMNKGANLTAKMIMPVLMKFPEELKIGQTVVMKGVLHPQEQRISFNLQHNYMETVALHFVVDFRHPAHSAFDTSRSYGAWDGAWRQEGLKPNPFKQGDIFDIRFRVHEDHFQASLIFVNGVEFDNYKFRIPLSSVTHMWVTGGGHLTYVQLGEQYNPIPYSATLKKTSMRKVEIPSARKMMPALFKFDEPLEIGQTVIVKGTLSAQEVRPWFNLQLNDMESVAIHFVADFGNANPHSAFDTSRGPNQWDGAWRQEGLKSNPFKKGEPFDVRFKIHDDHFQVFVNEKEFGTYKFRIPLATVNTLGVYGLGIVSYVQLGEQYEPVLNGSINRKEEDQKSLLPTVENFSNGFPVCGRKDSCSAKREMQSRNVSFADCKPLIITGYFEPYKGTPTTSVPGNFNIDFYRKNGDVAMSIIHRFDHNQNINFLWVINGVWKVVDTPLPKLTMKPGVKFEIGIINTVHGFQISVDGNYIYTFQHKMCPYDITEVVVTQHVSDLTMQL